MAAKFPGGFSFDDDSGTPVTLNAGMLTAPSATIATLTSTNGTFDTLAATTFNPTSITAEVLNATRTMCLGSATCNGNNSICAHTGCSGANNVHLGTPMVTNMLLAGKQPILRGSGTTTVESVGGDVHLGNPMAFIELKQSGEINLLTGSLVFDSGNNGHLKMTGANNDIRFFGGASIKGEASDIVTLTGHLNVTETLTVNGALVSSDRNKKKSLGPVDGEDYLQKIFEMPIEKWQYKKDLAKGKNVFHVGPYAQDFRKAFGLGHSEKTIDLIDINGVSFRAIQELIKKQRLLEMKILELEADKVKVKEKNRTLASENQSLKSFLQNLENRVSELEKSN